MNLPQPTRWPCAVLAWLASLLLLVSSSFAAPAVSNVRAAQRPGTNMVDVYYDLLGAETVGATVSVALSGDGGASYGLPVALLSGDVGSGVKNALNRRIVWDAGTDRPDSVVAAMRFRVTADSAPPLTGFALIPAGSFQMGDNFEEIPYGAELPVHTVFVSAFSIGRTEVTYGQWLEVFAWALNNGYTFDNVGSGKAANHPVQTASWYDVVKWCNAASERDGLTPVYRTSDGGVYRTGQIAPVINYANLGYRLPTEAEWEKAARGGLNGKRFPWGDTITHGQANYYVYSSNGTTNYFLYDVSSSRGYHPSYQSGVYPYTSPVGSFAANGYGLYDMAGNVWEWCNDWFGSDYYSSSPTSDPRGSSLDSARILRGGHSGEFAFSCKVAIRNGFGPNVCNEALGFRLARSL